MRSSTRRFSHISASSMWVRAQAFSRQDRQALENMPDTWVAQQYLEKWDGKLPQLISGDGSGVMLVPDLGE